MKQLQLDLCDSRLLYLDHLHQSPYFQDHSNKPNLPALNHFLDAINPCPLLNSLQPLGAPNANIILRVYLPPQEVCFPLRLRSCLTSSSFFESALRAFDIQDQIEKVAALRVLFEGKSDGRRNSQCTQLVKRGIPDSFGIFMYVVNGLPDLEKLKS